MAQKKPKRSAAYAAPGKTMTVNTRKDPLAVRSSPEAPVRPRQSNVIGSVQKGTVVTILELHGQWARIGKGQWVSAALLK